MFICFGGDRRLRPISPCQRFVNTKYSANFTLSFPHLSVKCRCFHLTISHVHSHSIHSDSPLNMESLTVAELRELLRRSEQSLKQAERQLRSTTFLEFLDAVHVNFSMNMKVQMDKTLATKGDPSNADGKLCPRLIRPWIEFNTQQKATWQQLEELSNTIKSSRVFSTLAYLEGSEFQFERMVASEKDLEFFERYAVESQVSQIIKHFSTDPVIKEKLHLNGGVVFENHQNTLSFDDPEVVSRMHQLSLQTPRKDSTKHNPVMTRAPELVLKHTDQMCVYNVAEDQNIVCFIIEYKAPHKLTLAHLKEGLRPMNPMKDLMQCPNIPSKDQAEARVAYHSGLLVAAVITQAFSYMVESGLQFGYVCTGEAFVFLNVRPEDPTTVYYHLSIPNIDVGSSTGWSPESTAPNLLHLTALGQVLAFTLQTLQQRALGAEWIGKAKGVLDRWVVDPQSILAQIPESVRLEIAHSEFKPTTRRQELLAFHSPRFLRSKAESLRQFDLDRVNEDDQMSSGDDEDDKHGDGHDDEDNDVDTPSRPSGRHRDLKKSMAPRKRYDTRNSGLRVAYCTQRCLRGLLMGGILDRNCPNHRRHHKHGDYHSITSETFLLLVRKQLFKNLDAGCYPLYVQGSRGALFKVQLLSHGYTVAAKCTIYAYVEDLVHEGKVYKQLEKIQGIHIPVCLGNINLERIYTFNCGVQIIHMMLMAWGGSRIDSPSSLPKLQLVMKQAIHAIHAIHELGILHMDVSPRNILWSDELQRVMFIDFERAVIKMPMPPLTANSALMPISPNPRRKWGCEAEKNTLRMTCEEPVSGRTEFRVSTERTKVEAKDMLLVDYTEQDPDMIEFRILAEEEGTENEVHWSKPFSSEIKYLKRELRSLQKAKGLVWE